MKEANPTFKAYRLHNYRFTALSVSYPSIIRLLPDDCKGGSIHARRACWKRGTGKL